MEEKTQSNNINSVEIEGYTEDEILTYDLSKQENITMDYRNSNFKIIRFYFEDIDKHIYLKQDFRLGKGGIFWDSV